MVEAPAVVLVVDLNPEVTERFLRVVGSVEIAASFRVETSCQQLVNLQGEVKRSRVVKQRIEWKTTAPFALVDTEGREHTPAPIRKHVHPPTLPHTLHTSLLTSALSAGSMALVRGPRRGA